MATASGFLAHPRLHQILQISGNAVCADCGLKGPRWASVNLGILLCIDCSGAHRAMGTHISKVKSLTLDQWTDAWLDSLANIGNTTAREYYEFRLPEGYKRPTHGDSRVVMETWIRNKYEKKLFTPQGILEPWELLQQGQNPKEVLFRYKQKIAGGESLRKSTVAPGKGDPMLAEKTLASRQPLRRGDSRTSSKAPVVSLSTAITENLLPPFASPSKTANTTTHSDTQPPSQKLASDLLEDFFAASRTTQDTSSSSGFPASLHVQTAPELHVHSKAYVPLTPVFQGGVGPRDLSGPDTALRALTDSQKKEAKYAAARNTIDQLFEADNPLGFPPTTFPPLVLGSHNPEKHHVELPTPEYARSPQAPSLGPAYPCSSVLAVAPSKATSPGSETLPLDLFVAPGETRVRSVCCAAEPLQSTGSGSMVEKAETRGEFPPSAKGSTLLSTSAVALQAPFKNKDPPSSVGKSGRDPLKDVFQFDLGLLDKQFAEIFSNDKECVSSTQRR